MSHRLALTCALLAGLAAQVSAGVPAPGPRMDILVGGSPRPRYLSGGTTYIEAIKGRPYEIHLTNPWPVRVAVALAIDGLNTIDARHTTAAAARKWVIEPYGALTISGWQTGLSDARRFEFTTEERSYGGILGRTANLGVITAVFFRERVPAPLPVTSSRNEAKAESAGAGGVGSADAASRPSAAPPAAQSPASAESANRDYAATGIGDRVDHAVREVSMDLDSSPAATIILRYEYRSALVQLGVLPAPVPEDDVLSRRERARGFAPGFCPDPARKW